MSKLSIGLVIGMGMVGLAFADNASQPSSLSSWTGFYGGLEAGINFNEVKLRSQQLGFTNPTQHCNTSSDFSTFAPGLQLGYMYQFPNYFVSGIETSISFNTNQNNSLDCSCPHNPDVSDRFLFRNKMQTAIKGRGGRALHWNKSILLPYLTAGASFANSGLTYKNEGDDFYSKNTTRTGLLLGAGIEWSFGKNWSVRTEYSYTDYGNTVKMKIPSVYGLLDPEGNARVALNTNSISVGINYWI